MLNYIWSFLRPPDPELSLEKSLEILCSTEPNQNLPVPNQTKISPKNEEHHSSTKMGKITAKQNRSYTIDSTYQFDADDEEFDVGETITYRKTICDGQILIYNVLKVQDDWDIPVIQSSLYGTKIIVCKVQNRERRFLHLLPDNIKVNLDKTSIEFIPIKGDWLELDILYEIDENNLNSCEKIIKVRKILPIRPHIESGQITYWNGEKRIGYIDRKIFFNQDALICGYSPIYGDDVVCEVIESDQNQSVWRAVKVTPKRTIRAETVTNTTNSIENHELEKKWSDNRLEVSDIKLLFKNINDTQKFAIKITNNSEKIFNFLNVQLPKSSCQIVLDTNNSMPTVIAPGQSLELNLICRSKTIGYFREMLTLNFDGLSLNKLVCINVAGKERSKDLPRDLRKCKNKNDTWDGFKQKLSVIRGQMNQRPRFVGKYVSSYLPPKTLLELMENNNRDAAIRELQKMNSSFIEDLTALNYEDKFHMLLFLSEIKNVILMKQYDTERACFIRNGEYLMMEIENLAERRPSIVIGDRIKVGDPRGILKEYYEGNVCKVGAKHVYLKFSSWFHSNYNGEDYAIKVIPGRASYRRQHHAVFLASKHLGSKWLFPSAIIEHKTAQVVFTYDPYDLETTKIKQPQPSQEVAANQISAESLLKLEWYNKKLNRKQKDAVINILKGSTRPMPYIIYGPPGTGKTVTLIESVLQVIRFMPGSRVLIAAPSNSAADLIALRLIASSVLRPGDLVRLISINYSTSDQIDAELVPFCAIVSGAKEGTMKEDVIGENGIMQHYSKSSLGRHKITVATCSSAGSLYAMGFSVGHFSHIFVDEAGQASEPEVLIPISFLDKFTGQVILAGDPRQLGPVITCPIASEYGLSESFLERIQNRFPYVRDIESFPQTEGFDCRLITKLLYNYRSLNSILQLFNTMFYNGDLIPTISDSDSEEAQLLKNLSSILPEGKNGVIPSVIFHGIEGQNYQSEDSPSWYNPHEAAQVFFYINEFYRLGVNSSDIGIITPYIKQVREIKHLLEESEFDVPKIGTVEDFQGQEFKIILVSTVRSSTNLLSHDYHYSLGFISTPRRLNVAISRARALLIIIGHPQLLSRDSYWRHVIDFCRESDACIGCELL